MVLDECINIAKNSSTDFELSEEETCRATIRMFVDFNLVSQFNIPYDVSCMMFDGNSKGRGTHVKLTMDMI